MPGLDPESLAPNNPKVVVLLYWRNGDESHYRSEDDVARLFATVESTWGRLDDAAERFESLALCSEHAADARVDRQTAQVRAPGDTYLAKAALERACEHPSGLIEGQRRARVGSAPGRTCTER